MISEHSKMSCQGGFCCGEMDWTGQSDLNRDFPSLSDLWDKTWKAQWWERSLDFHTTQTPLL